MNTRAPPHGEPRPLAHWWHAAAAERPARPRPYAPVRAERLMRASGEVLALRIVD